MSALNVRALLSKPEGRMVMEIGETAVKVAVDAGYLDPTDRAACQHVFKLGVLSLALHDRQQAETHHIHNSGYKGFTARDAPIWEAVSGFFWMALRQAEAVAS